VLNVISTLFPLHGIDGDLNFYSTVTKEIVKTFGQIAANEIEIATMPTWRKRQGRQGRSYTLTFPLC